MHKMKECGAMVKISSLTIIFLPHFLTSFEPFYHLKVFIYDPAALQGGY